MRIGLIPHISWYWGRHVVHRCKIESGLELNLTSPDTFEIPDDETRAEVRPGDLVKLTWSVKRLPGERMWVRVTERRGDRLVGTLCSWPVFTFLRPDETVQFNVDDIIDCVLEEDDEAA